MRRKQKSEPGKLTLAWTGLVVLLAALIATIHFLGSADTEKPVATLEIAGEPEKLAPDEEFENDIRQYQLEIAESEVPKPTAVKESSAQASQVSSEMPVQNEEDALKNEGDTATIIRIEDLPPSSTASTSTTGSNTPTGTRPPDPDINLGVSTRDGTYPRISVDGRRPSSYYRRKFEDPDDRPRIGIIVAGLGLSTSLTRQAIQDLPAEVTLAFAPYARDLPQWTSEARNAGHELMIEIPMEAAGVTSDNLGPAALLTSRTETENLQRLNWILARFQGYFGVTNYLGSKFSKDPDAITGVYTQLNQAGLAFLSDPELAPGAIGTNPSDYARIDLLIGNDETSPLSQLTYTETLAQERGAALIKIYPTPESLSAINQWAEALPAKGIVLAPASSMLQ